MVHGLAEQSRRAPAYGHPGEGTTAEMWLPAAVGPGGAPERAADRAAKADAHARRLTILAVDDDDLVLMNTSAMLEDLGHAVLEAHSGVEALQILKREPAIDLLVTDQAMPRKPACSWQGSPPWPQARAGGDPRHRLRRAAAGLRPLARPPGQAFHPGGTGRGRGPYTEPPFRPGAKPARSDSWTAPSRP